MVTLTLHGKKRIKQSNFQKFIGGTPEQCSTLATKNSDSDCTSFASVKSEPIEDCIWGMSLIGKTNTKRSTKIKASAYFLFLLFKSLHLENSFQAIKHSCFIIIYNPHKAAEEFGRCKCASQYTEPQEPSQFYLYEWRARYSTETT